MQRLVRLSSVSLVLSGMIAGSGSGRAQDPHRPPIARVWDEKALATLEVPLARSGISPVHVSADYYQRIPIRRIYKSYPVYHPAKEPPGYLDRLRRTEPEVVFDPSGLRTEADWIHAGEVVFYAPIGFASPEGLDSQICSFPDDVRDPEWYKATGMPLTEGGVLPFFRYVIRKKGLVELGQLSCATCHTRVMPDGTVIKGAQGNFPFDRAVAWSYRRHAPPGLVQSAVRQTFAVPGLEPDPLADLLHKPVNEIAAYFDAIPPGVLGRHGSSPFYPTVVPDLIGIEDIRYLDRSGLVQHRDIGDFMRYAALNQGADDLASFAGLIPAAEDLKTLPDPRTQSRYSDEQLYALARYVYSLRPPPNPNRLDGRAARGREVFQQQRCDRCHPPPLYTSNELLPVSGFRVPTDHREKYDVSMYRIDTSPELALRTRRGTGYYKVPSLRGVWYRGPFEHNGSIATLKDWFDPHRTEEGYVPTGFRGLAKSRAVKGHRFGLVLSAEDRAALIAFLKTL